MAARNKQTDKLQDINRIYANAVLYKIGPGEERTTTSHQVQGAKTLKEYKIESRKFLHAAIEKQQKTFGG